MYCSNLVLDQRQPVLSQDSTRLHVARVARHFRDSNLINCVMASQSVLCIFTCNNGLETKHNRTVIIIGDVTYSVFCGQFALLFVKYYFCCCI